MRWRAARSLILIFCFIAGAVHQLPLHAQGRPEGVVVTLKETRTAVTDDPKRQGMEVVERRMRMGNMGIRYQLVVDSRQSNRPVMQHYGDYFLACEFPPGSWNWNLEYFLDVLAVRPNEKPFCANRTMLQEGTYVLEQGQRGVADMVWPLPETAQQAPGRLAVRLVRLAGEVNWFYMEVGLEGDPAAQLHDVSLGAFPFITTGPPERQRWASTLTNSFQLTNTPAGFDPATGWGLVLHNKNAQEDGGCLLAFDPNEVRTASVGGTYGVSVHLAPKPGTRRLHLAVGYFWDTPFAQAVAQFRQDAGGILARLRQLDWSAHRNPEQWACVRQEIEGLLAHEAVKKQFASQWSTLSAEIASICTKTGQQALDREGDRRCALLMKQVQQMRTQLYEAALHALIQEATQSGN